MATSRLIPSRLFPVVAAALIDPQGRVLVQRRPAGSALAGLWEFPGGKIEPGESPEEALVRELAEELAIAVDLRDCVPASFATADHGERRLVLLLYLVRRWRGEAQAVQADALAWVMPDALGDLAMPPADVPLAAALARLVDPAER